MSSPHLTSWERKVRALVWCVTAVAAFYLVLQTHRHAVDLPFSDDFAFVDAIVGKQAVDLAWLWDAHNEHRMVVPKLVNVFATRALGVDFRAVAHVSALLLAVSAVCCVLAVAQLRRRYALEDCLIGLAVCTWAQSEAMTWTAPFNLVCTTAALLFWWCAASAYDAGGSVRTLVLASCAAVACALSGASGVAALLGVVPWFVWTAWSATSRRERALAAITAAALLAYGVLCAITYARPLNHPSPAPLLFTAAYFANLLGSPFSRLPIVMEVTGGLIGTGLAVFLLRAWKFRQPGRKAATALTLASLAIGAAVAMGRAGFGDLQIASRYITLMTPGAVAFFALVSLEKSPFLRRAFVIPLAAAVLISLEPSDKAGHTSARWLQKRLVAARAKILAGEDLSRVVEAHQLYPDSEYGAQGLATLREARGSVFRDVPAPSHP